MKKKSLPMQMSDKDNLRKNFSITERLNLNELDRQLINCKSSPISYHQFYQIARSIVEINFDENQINNENCQDQEEFAKTLTKLLQLCQTIIDFLLADTKRLQIEHSELTDRNNLIQENGKLRKLLQLQQKAILYGRMNMLSTNYCDTNKTNSNIIEDNSLDNFEQLSSDSKSNNQNFFNSKISFNKFQCIFCSKCFTDTAALSKHLHLTHLSSSVDDPSLSLSSSISSNLTCIQRIFQRCPFQPPNIQTLSEQKIYEEKINNLKNDLSKAFSLLEEEKLARKNFENNVKSDFEQQFNSIRLQLENEANRKLEKKNKLMKKKKEMVEDHVKMGNIEEQNGHNRELFYKNNNLNIATLSKQLTDTGIMDIDIKSSFTEQNFDTNEPAYSNDIIWNNSSNDDLTEQASIKQNLRNDLILQLKSRRLVKQKEMEKQVCEINHQLDGNKDNDLALCLDARKAQPIDYTDTKTEINESVEARIKSYLNKLSQNTININDEIFQETMNHINQDKTLLIQQSRYDYDFVKIENSIRQLIDSKVSTKLLDNSSDNDSEGKMDNFVPTVPLTNESSIEKRHLNNAIESVNTAALNDNQFESKLLKSILKIKTNNNEKSNSPKRNISFNNEVIEFEISPLTSENEDDESVLDLDGKDHKSLKIVSKNQIEESSQSNQIFDTGPNNFNIHFNNESHFDGEKIFLDDSGEFSTSSSSSSSSSENDENDNHNSDTFRKQQINVPVPAKRNNKETSSVHSASAFNSLLSPQDSNYSADNQSRPTKVQELAELIEKKLKKPISDQMKYLNSNQRLPPISVNLNDTADSNQF